MFNPLGFKSSNGMFKRKKTPEISEVDTLTTQKKA